VKDERFSWRSREPLQSISSSADVTAQTIACGGQVRSLRPWLYRIAHNTALNALRDRPARDEPLEDVVGREDRPEQVLERREVLLDALSAVQGLPLRQRDAIVLCELEGRSYDEIAGRLGVTNGAVRQLLNRARVSLRPGVTALSPAGALLRLTGGAGDASTAVRIAELGAGTAAGGGVAIKLCASVLATCAAAGGLHATSGPAREDRTAAVGRRSRRRAARAACPTDRRAPRLASPGLLRRRLACLRAPPGACVPSQGTRTVRAPRVSAAADRAREADPPPGHEGAPPPQGAPGRRSGPRGQSAPGHDRLPSHPASARRRRTSGPEREVAVGSGS